MRPDRYVALVILAFCVAYGYMSWTYPLLPFERFQAFRPNVMPMGLSALGILFSIAVLIKPGGNPSGLVDEVAGWQSYEWHRFAAIVLLMVFYAATIRSLGFILATSLFVILGGLSLGEKRILLLLIVSITAAVLSWYLVDQALGIFLKPLPGFIGTN